MPALPLVVLLSCCVIACGDEDQRRDLAPARGSVSGEVEMNIPSKLTSIEVDGVDPLGNPLRIACASCHTTKEVSVLPESASELRSFHAGLQVAHGETRCASCHVSRPFTAPMLRLADGTELPMTDALRLCAQCHGPQYRDYNAGAHGGMQGAWDLSRGNRIRNHCVDCHDPHLPKPPRVLPAAAMRDRVPVPHRVHGEEGGE